MLSTDATTLLDGVKALHQERLRWIKLVSLDVTVTSAVEGAVTMRWLVNETQLRHLMLDTGVSFATSPASTLLLPVFTSERVQVPVTEGISMIGLSGSRRLSGVHCDTLRRVAEQDGKVQLSREHDRVLTVALSEQNLSELAELAIEVPFVPQDATQSAPRPFRRPFSAVNPVGLIKLTPLWDVEPETGLGVALPEEVRADTAVLSVAARLDTDVDDDLRQLADELAASPRAVLRGPIVARQMRRIEPVVRRAATQVKAEARRLDRIGRPGVDMSKAKSAVAKASDHLTSLVAEIDQRAAKAEARGRRARVKAKRLVTIAEQARRTYTSLNRHRVMTSLEPTPSSTGSFTAACPAAPLEEMTIVYSTGLRHLRMHRLGTSRALVVIGTVLLLIAWRLEVMWPLSRQEANPIDVVQADALRSSRDALVALLVIFPALLYTQLERIGSDRTLLDNTVGVAMTCASLAFLLPMGIGVLAAGDIRPTLVIRSCAFAGAIAIALGAFVAVVLSEMVLSRLRAYSCRKVVSR